MTLLYLFFICIIDCCFFIYFLKIINKVCKKQAKMMAFPTSLAQTKQLNTFLSKEPIVAMKLVDPEALSMVTLTKSHLCYWNPEQQTDKRPLSSKPQFTFPSKPSDIQTDTFTSLAVVNNFIIVGTAEGMLRVFEVYNQSANDMTKPVWSIRQVMDRANTNQPLTVHSEAEQYAILDMTYMKPNLHVLYQGGRVCTFRNIGEDIYKFQQKVPYWCVQPLANRISVSEKYPNYLFAANFISVKCFTVPDEKDVKLGEGKDNKKGEKKAKVPFVHVSESAAYDTAVSNTTCLVAEGDYLLLGSGHGYIAVWRMQEAEINKQAANADKDRKSLIVMKEKRMTFAHVDTWWVHGRRVTAACLNLKKVSVLTFDADGCFVETGIRQGDEINKDIVHQDKVTGAQLISDKGLLITCAGDRMAKVWQAWEAKKEAELDSEEDEEEKEDEKEVEIQKVEEQVDKEQNRVKQEETEKKMQQEKEVPNKETENVKLSHNEDNQVQKQEELKLQELALQKKQVEEENLKREQMLFEQQKVQKQLQEEEKLQEQMRQKEIKRMEEIEEQRKAELKIQEQRRFEEAIKKEQIRKEEEMQMQLMQEQKRQAEINEQLMSEKAKQEEEIKQKREKEEQLRKELEIRKQQEELKQKEAERQRQEDEIMRQEVIQEEMRLEQMMEEQRRQEHEAVRQMAQELELRRAEEEALKQQEQAGAEDAGGNQ